MLIHDLAVDYGKLCLIYNLMTVLKSFCGWLDKKEMSVGVESYIFHVLISYVNIKILNKYHNFH